MAASAQPDSVFQGIALALRSRGWKAFPSELGVSYKKNVEVKGGTVDLTLVFLDNDVTQPPKAFIGSLSGRVPVDFPWHRIGAFFCYLDEDNIEWDPNASGFCSNVVWAADYAERRLTELSRASSVPDADQEFAVHWQGTPVYSDLQLTPNEPLDGARLELLYLKRSYTSYGPDLRILTKPGQYETRFSEFELSAQAQTVPAGSIYASGSLQVPKRFCTPTNLSELLQWADDQTEFGRKEISRQVAKALSAGRSSGIVLLLIESPEVSIGVLCDTRQLNMQNFGTGARLAENLRTKQLASLISVERLELRSVSERFLWSRNSPIETAPLQNQCIHVIGAGSIGSLLAKELVCLGCGMGAGHLHLYDTDRLLPENVSRHLLGVDYLGESKASAVRHYLKRSLLAGNVEAFDSSGADPALHANADLVIDATGAPSVSNRLNAAAARGEIDNVMFVSVCGEGWAAMAHLYDGKKGSACRNCVQPWVGGRCSPIPGGHEETIRRPSCGGAYIPFYGFAASMAAAQAAELAMDWARESAGKPLRVTTVESAPGWLKHVPSGSPKPLPECYCQTLRQDVYRDS